jgi:hypothetical protein
MYIPYRPYITVNNIKSNIIVESVLVKRCMTFRFITKNFDPTPVFAHRHHQLMLMTSIMAPFCNTTVRPRLMSQTVPPGKRSQVALGPSLAVKGKPLCACCVSVDVMSYAPSGYNSELLSLLFATVPWLGKVATILTVQTVVNSLHT